MGVHEQTPSNGENPFKSPQKETQPPKEQDKKFTFTSVMNTVSPEGGADPALSSATEGVNPLFESQLDSVRDGGDKSGSYELVNEARSTSKPVQREIDFSAPDAVRERIKDIEKTQALLMRLYEPAEDGGLDLKEGTMPDGKGGEISIEDLHAQLVDQLSLNYEYSLMQAQKITVPSSTTDATMIGLQRESEYHRSGIESGVELLTEVGIFGPDLPASQEIVTAVLAQDIEMDPLIKEKFEDLAYHYEQLAQLDEKRARVKLLQDGPAVAHLEYAQFLVKFGMPNAAEEHYELALKSAPHASRSEQVKKLAAEIEKDKNDYVHDDIVDNYLRSPENPFELIKLANERVKENDTFTARQLLETAREFARKIKPDDVERDLRKIGEERQRDLAHLAAKLEYRRENGNLTPGQVLTLAERERRAKHDQELLTDFKLARAKTDMALANFLLNDDSGRNTERNRKQALEILLAVRYDKNGRIAAAQDARNFEANLEKALQGPNGNQTALESFAVKMKAYSELRESAVNRAQNGESNEAVASDLEEARNQAQLAKQLATRIDRNVADRNMQDLRAQIQLQIEQELAKPDESRDDGKVLLLREIAKPFHQQNREVIELLVEMFKPESERNEEQVRLLENVVKDKDALLDVLSSFSMLTQMNFQKQALNEARLATVQVDVMLGKGEDHPDRVAIEQDPFGEEFIESLGKTPDGKDIWPQIKDATKEVNWFDTAREWFKGNVKDLGIAVAAGSGGFFAGTTVAALSCWSGPGAVIAGSATAFATGAAIGSMLHAASGDKVTPQTAAFNGVDGLSGGLFGATRNVALRSGAAALEGVIGGAAAKLTARETFDAFVGAGVADKLRIAASTKFGASMIGSTLSSSAYRFGHEGINYYEGKYRGFSDYITTASAKVMSDIPGNATALVLTSGIERFIPSVGPRVQAFNEYMNGGPITVQLRSDSTYRPAFQRENFSGIPAFDSSNENI